MSSLASTYYEGGARVPVEPKAMWQIDEKLESLYPHLGAGT